MAAIAVIVVVVVTATVVVVVCWRVKHRRFKKVLPISNNRDSDSKSAFEDDVQTEEDELEITHAKSLEVLIPRG